MARPSKLTPEIQTAIVKRIERGNYPEIAAQAEGIAASTYYLWMQKGDAGEAPYSEFSEAVERARARAEVTWVEELATSDNTHDRKWLLERTRRERYGQSIDVGMKDQAYEHVFAWLREELDPETFGRLVERRADAGGEEAPSADETHH